MQENQTDRVSERVSGQDVVLRLQGKVVIHLKTLSFTVATTKFNLSQKGVFLRGILFDNKGRKVDDWQSEKRKLTHPVSSDGEITMFIPYNEIKYIVYEAIEKKQNKLDHNTSERKEEERPQG